MDYSEPLDRLASDEEAHEVASKTRKKFHRPGWEYAQYISTLKRLALDSHASTREAGFNLCRTCQA